MEKTQPIKRHPAIVELSKDHHFGLLLTWKIRQGLKKEIDPSRISSYILHFFDLELKAHFREEEELLFNKIPPGNPLRIQAENEHQLIYKLCDELRTKANDHSLIGLFADTLEKHIRFEERELFNYLQETIPGNTLSEIATAIGIKKRPEDCWNDEFWLS